MDMKLELVLLPVSDVDRAKAFYGSAGFTLDVDHDGGPEFRVVQFTPPGSACSITFGIGVSDAPPGSVRGLHLVVTDLAAARTQLIARGIDVGEPFHYGPGGRTPGIDPEHRDYQSYAELADPDGNLWLLQEVGHHRP